MSNSSIWMIEKTLSDSTTLGQRGPGSDGNKEILHIPQSSRTKVSPSDGLMSYPWHLLVLGGVLPLSRDAVGVFYSSSWLGCQKMS